MLQFIYITFKFEVNVWYKEVYQSGNKITHGKLLPDYKYKFSLLHGFVILFPN